MRELQSHLRHDRFFDRLYQLVFGQLAENSRYCASSFIDYDGWHNENAGCVPYARMLFHVNAAESRAVSKPFFDIADRRAHLLAGRAVSGPKKTNYGLPYRQNFLIEARLIDLKNCHLKKVEPRDVG